MIILAAPPLRLMQALYVIVVQGCSLHLVQIGG